MYTLCQDGYEGTPRSSVFTNKTRKCRLVKYIARKEKIEMSKTFIKVNK